MTTYSEQEQRERNNQALRAWKEWKKECRIVACNPENRRILTGEVTRAFNRELVKALRIAHVMGPGGSENCWRKPAEECVVEFDNAIREADTERLNRQTGKPRKRKKWKNVVWRKMATSQDAPLKVLRGNLTGPASFMRDAVREYVQRDYQIWNKRCAMSLNEPLGSSEEAEGATLEDRILDTSSTFDLYLEPSPRTDDEQRQLAASLDASFTLPDMALALAKASRVAVTDYKLLTLLGLGPSAAYDRQGQALKKLKTWFSDWGANAQDASLSFAVLEHFFARLSAENVPEALLSQLNPHPQKG